MEKANILRFVQVLVRNILRFVICLMMYLTLTAFSYACNSCVPPHGEGHSITHSPMVFFSVSKLMPTFTTGNPQRAKREG